MELAARAPSMAALFVEPCPSSEPWHSWTIDQRTRAHIDWTRGTVMELADDFMIYSPREMRRIMEQALAYIDAIMPRLTVPADRQHMLVARMLVASTHDNYAALSLDAVATEMMAASRLLLTGTDYEDKDAPEDMNHGRN